MPTAEISKVHILHVVPTLRAGGLELALAGLVNRLGDMKHSIICMRGEADISEQFNRDVQIHCIRSKSNELKLPFRLARLIKRIKPDVIHTNNWGAWSEIAIASFLLLKRPPMIFTFHGLSLMGPPSRKRRFAGKILARKTDLALTVCDASRQVMADQYGLSVDRIGVIYNGVDTELFAPAGKPPNEPLVIGSVGSLLPIKNHALLIRSVADLLAVGVDLQLRIAGDGPIRSQLTDLAESLGIADSVRFLGAINDVPDFLRGLDIFAQPSDTEAMPISILEAMSSALPSVATDVGGVSEIFAGGAAGKLIAPGDQKALTEVLLELAGDGLRRQTLGQAGRDRVCEHFSLASNIAKYRYLYEQFASGNLKPLESLNGQA